MNLSFVYEIVNILIVFINKIERIKYLFINLGLLIQNMDKCFIKGHRVESCPMFLKQYGKVNFKKKITSIA